MPSRKFHVREKYFAQFFPKVEWNDIILEQSDFQIKLFKKTKTGFLKGRFGLELADFSTFDVDPSTTLGYMLQDWTWVRSGLIGVVLGLRLGPARLGAGLRLEIKVGLVGVYLAPRFSFTVERRSIDRSRQVGRNAVGRLTDRSNLPSRKTFFFAFIL